MLSFQRVSQRDNSAACERLTFSGDVINVVKVVVVSNMLFNVAGVSYVTYLVQTSQPGRLESLPDFCILILPQNCTNLWAIFLFLIDSVLSKDISIASLLHWGNFVHLLNDAKTSTAKYRGPEIFLPVDQIHSLELRPVWGLSPQLIGSDLLGFFIPTCISSGSITAFVCMCTSTCRQG